MHHPARYVFEVPELVGLICSFLDKRNLPNLLTVSRRLFYGAAPLIWKELLGFHKLFFLLPRLNAEEFARAGPKASCFVLDRTMTPD